MSDKVRIHDLAKKYGMPGKNLAAKLRDFGFSQARSHMSSLDAFEAMQAEGILGANGIMPIGEDGADSGSSGISGLKVKRRRKKVDKAAPPEAPTPTSASTPGVPATEPEAAPDEDLDPPPQVAWIEVPASEQEVQPASEPQEASVDPERQPDEATAQAHPAEPQTEIEELPEQAEALDQPPEQEKPGAEGDSPKPRGNVVGFIDPTKFQESEVRRRPESRKLQSRDDSAPDVRPTFTHGGKGGRGAAGPRGNLTAAELRQREQGRFLRRTGRPVTRGRGGRRGGVREESGGRRHEDVTVSPFAEGTVMIEAPITIAKLAESLKLKSALIQKQALQQQLGMFTLNTLLDDDTAVLLAAEFKVALQVQHEISAEEAHLDEVKKKRSEIEEEKLNERAPTVAFLGHVDHGKTTLIDKIRDTKVAEHEAGGITQHIGAYQVKTSKGHTVTIVDTPGHQAFTAMRARGAQAVDIVVLVVAGDDGVKPSTEEAVNHARVAGTPIVVAINKKDSAGFNANATIQQLMGLELVPEEFGGSTAMFHTSGITGEGIDELLEHIFLMGDAELGLRAHPSGPASGVVLEAEMQQGHGIVAHLLVQDGTLNQGDILLAGEGYGKVKAIRDDRGMVIPLAGPSTPVAVIGLAALPGVGDPFYVIEKLAKAKEIATERERNNRAMALAGSRETSRDLASILGTAPVQTIKFINLILRADVQGSAEVVRHEVEKLKHEEVEVRLLHSGVGPITESDVDLAATSDALLVAFSVGINSKARQLADRNGLEVRRYGVLYELLEDLRNLMEGTLSPEFDEVVQGHAEIRQVFKSSKIGLIAGCFVLDGKITRNSKVRLLRDDTVVYTGSLSSLRRESDDAKEAREGFECGAVLRDYSDIKQGDIIEAFTMKEVKRTLEGGRV